MTFVIYMYICIIYNRSLIIIYILKKIVCYINKDARRAKFNKDSLRFPLFKASLDYVIKEQIPRFSNQIKPHWKLNNFAILLNQ